MPVTTDWITLSFAAGLFFPALLVLAAALIDLKTFRIPNQLVLVGVALALLLSESPTGVGWLDALQGLALGFALLLPFYLIRVMGAGDVKLMAMVGAFVGGDQILAVWLLTLLCGGVLSLALALRHRMLGAVLRNTGWIAFATLNRLGRDAAPTLAAEHGNKARLPYAVAIAGGTLMTLARPWIGF
ncbi:prepilin peptidase [Crenobacter intestini]|uniref:Prepilin peptidase n=2 Tax=Crenobacter intestini TaxID=2563443 RepID=A0A4T0V164_9NEIS|nr:prepilin peptidase [Crenobacter intestini]